MTNNVLASEANPFRVGDRVSERMRTKMVPYVSKRARSGVVESVATEINKRGSRMEFVYVLWDGYKSPSKHMRNRIYKVSGADTFQS